jgi:hypothetical protein
MKGKKKTVSKSPRAQQSPARVKSESKNPRINVLIADDHSVVREGLVSLITRKADMTVIGRGKQWRRSGRSLEKTSPQYIAARFADARAQRG